MFDKIVRVSAQWDWITPLITVVQNWRYRPTTGFSLPFGHSYSAWEIKRFLKSKGIRVWGVMVIGDSISIRVRKAQALYTQYWLEQLGIPYQGGLSPKEAELYRTAHKRTDVETHQVPLEQETTNRKDTVDSINGLVDRIEMWARNQ